jgi:oligopeptide/dipeptide ABC transporter ATP-binding protein
VEADPKALHAPLLEVRGIRKSYAPSGFFARGKRVVAADDISFQINRGQAVALVGESGSGKSSIARVLVRLEPPDRGEVRLDGADVLAGQRHGVPLSYRRRVQMVFQDPFGSLNPVHTVAHHLVRPLLRHHRVGVEAGAARVRALELLRTVGLDPAEEFIDRHPFQLSGGQRQRVAIARTLAVEPDLLIADEPTSMLDVSIRMGILNLLVQLKRERQLAILLITHDLASARYLADRILVLHRGRIVEDGPGGALVEAPAHPYTRALLAAIADTDRTTPAARRPVEKTTGEPAAGCPFAPRCPDVFALCRTTDPASRLVDGRRVRCHLYPADAQAPAN